MRSLAIYINRANYAPRSFYEARTERERAERAITFESRRRKQPITGHSYSRSCVRRPKFAFQVKCAHPPTPQPTPAYLTHLLDGLRGAHSRPQGAQRCSSRTLRPSRTQHAVSRFGVEEVNLRFRQSINPLCVCAYRATLSV